MSALGGINLDFSSDMLGTAVANTAPASSGVYNFSDLFASVKQQAPSLINNYLTKRVAAITAPKVMQLPANTAAAASAPGLNLSGLMMPAGLLLVVGGVTYAMRNKEKK